MTHFDRCPLWWQTTQPPEYPAIHGDRTFDVAVLGGGITGLTTALLLKRRGARVAVVEADRIASGATGANTAKVSALQSTMYSTIRAHRGHQAASAYAAASEAAVATVGEIAAGEEIACDLRRRTAYTYATTDRELSAVEREGEATRNAGLPTALTEETDLPFAVAGAVRLEDQIEFHPVAYAAGLAAAVHGDGSEVFEHTRALGVAEGTPCRVDTTNGGTLRAGRVVVATHYPILDRGLYFARLDPARSYCIAARLRDTPARGLTINAGNPKRSTRSYGDLLIVSGENHPVGARGVDADRYQRLENFAREHWDVDTVTHRWSAQDPTPYDHFPMVGAYTPISSRLFVATGFMKWGLTGGTLSAIVLAETIAGRQHPWAEELTPNRLSPRSVPDLARLNGKTVSDFVSDRVTPGRSDVDAVGRGQARVVREGRELTGVYRDDEGALHAVSLRCTHLGCLLRFNGADRSWDCPCHGSRFDIDGTVLEGPAVRPLETKSPPTSEGTAG